MPRNITVTFEDGTTHVYQNAPDNVTPDQVAARAQKDFGKSVKALDGGRKPQAQQRAQAQPKKRSWMQDLGDGTVNVLAGAVQGAASIPDAVTQGIGGAFAFGSYYGGKALGAAADAVGLDGNSIRKEGARLSRGFENPVTIGGTVEKVAPTPQNTAGKVARFGAQLVGGAAVPVGPKVTPPVKAPAPKPNALMPQAPAKGVIPNGRQVVAAAKEAKISVMTSDIRPPRTFVGKSAQALGERIPIAGTGGTRQTQQVARIEAVKQLAKDFGAGVDDAIDDVAKDLVKTRGAELSNLTAAKNSVITGIKGAVPVPQATKAIDEQIAKLSRANPEAFAPVISRLQSFKEQLGRGLSLEDVEVNRRLLGDMFKDPNLASIAGDGQKALNAIYAPLRGDMGNFIKAQGGQGAFVKWKGANDRLAAMAGELGDKTFKNVLSQAEATPENVSRLLFSKKPSDVGRLYANLSANGRLKAQSAVLHEAVTKAGGLDNISPDQFVNQIGKLGRTVGVHFQGPDLARLEGLAQVINATKRAATAGVVTNSGQQVVPYAIPAVLTQMFGLTGGVGVAGGAGILARIYESPAVRDSLLKLGRAQADSPQAQAQLGRAINAIAVVAKDFSEKMAVHANDNVGVVALAGNGPENQGEQQPMPQP